jgi:hypothetical protein
MSLDTFIIYKKNISLDQKFKPEPRPVQNVLGNVEDYRLFAS